MPYARGMSHPEPETPRPAATLVLVRQAGAAFEVFLVKRHGRAGFFANAHVFPGGRVDDGDAQLAAPPDETMRLAAAFAEAPTETAASFGVAAIRETLEESGFLLARDAHGATPSAEVARAVRRALGEAPFVDVMARFALLPDTAALAPLGWWVTPIAEPRRFAARFFLAEAPTDLAGAPAATETVASAWVTPRGALAASARGEMLLAPPTFAVLEDLAAATSIDAARAVPLPIRAICPVLVTIEHGLVLALPGDPLHGDDTPASAVRTRMEMGKDARLRSLWTADPDRGCGRGRAC